MAYTMVDLDGGRALELDLWVNNSETPKRLSVTAPDPALTRALVNDAIALLQDANPYDNTIGGIVSLHRATVVQRRAHRIYLRPAN